MPNSEQKSGTSVRGNFDDDALVCGLVTDAIKASGLSRIQIAERISDLVGQRVTASMLYDYSAESKSKHRFPLSFARAFCQVTGDARLLGFLVERSGLQLITADEQQLLELGRQYLIEKRAAEKRSAIEQQLTRNGVSL